MGRAIARPSVHRHAAAALALLAAGAARAQVSVGANFEGSSYFESGFVPPDTMGAIGPAHFVELINGRYAAYERDGTLAAGSSLDGFFKSGGVSPTAYAFDPRIVFDHRSGRWFAAAADAPGGPNRFLVAVSHSSDPTDGWTALAFDSDPDNQQWADFPMLGIDDYGLYVAANMFGLGGAPFKRHVLVVPKTDLLAPVPTAANATLIENVPLNGTAHPATSFDEPGPFEVPMLARTHTSFQQYGFITGSVASPVVLGGGSITVTALPGPASAVQPPLPFQKAPIYSGDARYASSVVVVQGVLYAVHGANVAGKAGVRFLELDPADGTVLQDTAVADPDLALIHPSVGVNRFGDVVIGCTGSSATQPASSYAVCGTTSGGVTTFGAPIMLRAGLDDYEFFDSIGRNRWGDYSATTVDPTDPRRIWTIQEFVLADDIWATQISELIFPTPPCPWDCDGSDDGLVGVDDFLALLGQWGMSGTSCHVAGGAFVGVDDLLELLASWGPCPE